MLLGGMLVRSRISDAQHRTAKYSVEPSLPIVTRTPLMARNRKLPVSTREGLVHQLRAGILRTQKTTNAYLKRHKGLSYDPTVMSISEELSC